MLQGFPIAEVGVFVRTKSDSMAMKLAKKLCDQYLKFDLVSGLQTFIELCYSIDQAKVRSIGRDASTKESNYLMFLVAVYWVDRSTCDSTTVKEIEKVSDRLQKNGAWEYPKLYNLTALVNRKVLTMEMAEVTKLPKLLRRITAPIFRPGTEEFLDSHIIQLIHAMGELRKYGLKPAAFNDLYSMITGKQWVITDGSDNAREWAAKDALGTFYLTDKDTTDLRYVNQTLQGEHYLMKGTVSSFQPFTVWTLNDSGHLDLSGGLGLMSCQEIFEKADAMGLYDAIRINSVMHVFDLVVPMNIACKVPGVRMRRGLGNLLSNIFNLGNSMRELIVPRLRSLESIGQVESDLQDEISRDIAATARLMNVREHEVVGFTRRIRAGYQAPMNVKIRAWEESRIKLQPGETYVRKHKRGNSEKGIVTGHRIKKRWAR